MNTRNMSISFQDWKLTILYDCGPMQKVVLKDYTGHISFYSRNAESFSCDISKHVRPNAVFLKPYGVSIAEDGSCFFIQSWEKGLFCFALPSGELLWRSKRNHATKLVLLPDRVICQFVDYCVDAMDIHSGEVLAHYPLGWNTQFLPLNDNFYLAGPKRGKYYVLDCRLEVREVVAYQRLNPALLDTCCIVDAVAVPGGMTISGFEYMDDYYHEQKLMGNTDMEQYQFSRFVPLDCVQ
ncbi:MAG: hypothetical protein IJ448_00990 [Oscillospiraceae bacterium]|nr:hypothetical protein [Oscillospiraceae bacterium]